MVLVVLVDVVDVLVDVVVEVVVVYCSWGDVHHRGYYPLVI